MKIEFNLEDKTIILDENTMPKTEGELLKAQELTSRLLISLFKQGMASIETQDGKNIQSLIESNVSNIIAINREILIKI